MHVDDIVIGMPATLIAVSRRRPPHPLRPPGADVPGPMRADDVATSGGDRRVFPATITDVEHLVVEVGREEPVPEDEHKELRRRFPWTPKTWTVKTMERTITRLIALDEVHDVKVAFRLAAAPPKDGLLIGEPPYVLSWLVGSFVFVKVNHPVFREVRHDDVMIAVGRRLDSSAAFG